MARPIQIDPYGCGCTECLTGEYVPLDRATWEDIDRMIRKEISNASGDEFAIGPDKTYVSRYSKLRWDESVFQRSNWFAAGYTYAETREPGKM